MFIQPVNISVNLILTVFVLYNVIITIQYTNVSQYRNSNDKDKMIMEPHHLYNDNFYSGKTLSLCWLHQLMLTPSTDYSTKTGLTRRLTIWKANSALSQWFNRSVGRSHNENLSGILHGLRTKCWIILMVLDEKFDWILSEKKTETIISTILFNCSHEITI